MALPVSHTMVPALVIDAYKVDGSGGDGVMGRSDLQITDGINMYANAGLLWQPYGDCSKRFLLGVAILLRCSFAKRNGWPTDTREIHGVIAFDGLETWGL